MDSELPTMNSHSFSCSNYSGTAVDWLYRPNPAAIAPYQQHDYSDRRITDALLQKSPGLFDTLFTTTKQETTMADPKFRVVRVLIVDTDKNLPLDMALLYSGSEQFTDATDQELFFDIDIKGVLATHNERRATIVDKEKSEGSKQVFLEPIKIRDLTMTVVTVASF